MKVCYQVLSFVWRMAGHQFSGVTQLLPFGQASEVAEEALESFLKALGGKVPLTAHEPMKLARDAFAWQQYRTSTKQLLLALGNALQQVMPQSFSFLSAKPSNLLAPRGPGERYQYLPEELVLQNGMAGLSVSFVHDPRSGLRFPDFYLSEDFYRLVFSADEGTEAGS